MTSINTERLRKTNSGAAIKVACQVASTGNLTLSGEQTVDGIALLEANEDRVLCKDQTDATENGIYIVSTGAWTRAPDFNGSFDVVEGTIIPVSRGTVNADTEFRISTIGDITVGTTGLTFEARGASDASGQTYTPAGTGAVSTTTQAKLREFVSVVDFGALGDGANDDTSAINSALTAGAGGTVYMPEGAYLISSTLTVPVGTALIGPATCDIYNPATVGATINVTHTGTEAILLGRGSRIDGVNFYYPNQITTSPPTVYDWCIELDFTDTGVQNGNNPACKIQNLVIHNCYKGILLGGDASDSSPSHGMEVIENVKMYALHTGIKSDAVFVESNLINVVFSPQFWTASIGQAVRQWVMTSGNACVEYGGGQGLQMTDVLLFGHRRGIYSTATGIPAANENLSFLKCTSCTFDGLRTGVEVTGETGISGTFTGCTFLSADAYNSGFTTGKCVYLNDNEYPSAITFSGCEFLGSTGDHVHDVQSAATVFNKLIFSGCAFGNANRDNDAGSYYNFYIDNTRLQLTVSGSTIYNNNDSTVTNFEIVNAHTLTVANNTIFDDASTPFNIGTISNNYKITNNACNVTTTTASAATVTIPEHAEDYVQITGTTGITSITASYLGRRYTLLFGGALTVTDGSNLVLAGNFTTTANDTLTLVCDGTNWYEVARSVN